VKKDKINTKDGSEFTVYYLNENDSSQMQVTPSTSLGHYVLSGDTFIEPLTEAQGKLMPDESYAILIDDTIPSDYVKSEDLVAGRLYKSHNLDIVVRFVETAHGIGSDYDDYARVSRHGEEFLMRVDDLRKASHKEVEKYLEKKVD